jgi:hypothetical protein
MTYNTRKMLYQRRQKNALTINTGKMLGPTTPEKCCDQQQQNNAGTNNTGIIM